MGVLTNDAYQESEAINNLDASEEFGVEGNDAALENGALDNTVSEVVDNAAMDPMGDENVSNEIMETNYAPTEFSAPLLLVVGGVVRYVGLGGTPVYDSPDGKVVKTMNQGDHPVVLPDGAGWGETMNGFFVPEKINRISNG